MLFYLVMAFIFGAVVGSFLNVCIVRIPKDESVVFPPSRCTACGQPIAFCDMIPILSWLALRGRCRKCAEKISPRYILVEILMGFLTAALIWQMGIRPPALVYLVFVAALLVVSFIDLDHKIIPDIISIPGIVIGFCSAGWLIGFLNSCLGIVIGGGSLFFLGFLYRLFTKKEGMGEGDIKLLAMIGAFIGWEGVLFTLFVSSLTGSLAGLLAMAIQKKGRQFALPFGPFLSLGAVLYIFWGPLLIDEYLHLVRIH